MKKRSISGDLMKILGKDGVFHPLVEIVKVDPYLDMEMRGEDGVMVYYRGGKLLTLNERGEMIGIDDEYYPDNCNKIQPDINNIHDYISKAKHIIDLHESNDKIRKLGEKEIQQRIVYENNLSVNADNTDYFIADVEWADNETLGGRADIVAFRWNHMEHRKRRVQLTLIEVKQGDGAITTTNTKDKNGKPKVTAGLRKHYEDYLKFNGNKEDAKQVAEDMLRILHQKNELGLVKGLDKLFKSGSKDIIPDIEDDIDFIFLLANYHHYSSALQSECSRLTDDCKFFLSSFLGYGLYKDFIVNKEALETLFPHIFSKSNSQS